ncbi:hypothetical protein PQR66_08640 [Paraburkholderia agricolaris]|uniref:Uncharacterized protein n=1 Tax=Paraburkholderia agricolaris TaxID=2152888 RepID=A0ABW8ZK07_9BURK
MTVRPAISTPRQLPRKREAADKRPRLSLAGAVPAHASNDDVNSSGLAPAKAIQRNEAPLARRKAIQKKESESDSRLANLARISAIRIEIRKLVEAVAHGADIELLDLMRDEVGSFSRHKAAQEARTWANAAGVQLETGLMMLDRAMRPTST